jgi:hypothetical protein
MFSRAKLCYRPTIDTAETIMASEIWLSLSSAERSLLREALAAYSGGEAANKSAAAALSRKIAHTTPHPDITVGVHGGQVQWTQGNPFAIRICDYDGDEQDLPNVDESGRRCRMWFEPADNETFGI